MSIMETDMALSTYLFAGKYKIEKKIGRGSYATIYLAADNILKEKVAIKLESATNTDTTIPHERVIYEYLTDSDRVPRVRYYGQAHGYNFIIMDLLGPSLRRLHRIYKKFSLGSVLQLANQILLILEYLHNHSIIHRDIKPENFLIGRGKNSNYIYIIDFGLAIKYNKTDPQCLDMCKNYFVGNAIFASCKAHESCEPAPRDDLESLGYLLVYFLQGKLPWCGIKTNSFDEQVAKTGQMKLTTSVEELCVGLPGEFGAYLKYCRGLESTDVPDYEYLRQLFGEVAKRMNFSNDDVFDWTQTKQS